MGGGGDGGISNDKKNSEVLAECNDITGKKTPWVRK